MPECQQSLSGGADTLPGHALIEEGKPHCLRRSGDLLTDVLAEGPNGYALCECTRGSGWRTSDKARRQWHADHLRDERCKLEDEARIARLKRRLLRGGGVVEVRRRRSGRLRYGGRGGGDRQHGGAGGSGKGGGNDDSPDLMHCSSRLRRARECARQTPLCAAERRLHPLLTC